MDALQRIHEEAKIERERIDALISPFKKMILKLEKMAEELKIDLDAKREQLTQSQVEQAEKLIHFARFLKAFLEVILLLRVVTINHIMYHEKITSDSVEGTEPDFCYNLEQMFDILKAVPSDVLQNVFRSLKQNWELIDAINSQNFDGFRQAMLQTDLKERNLISIMCTAFKFIDSLYPMVEEFNDAINHDKEDVLNLITGEMNRMSRTYLQNIGAPKEEIDICDESEKSIADVIQILSNKSVVIFEEFFRIENDLSQAEKEIWYEVMDKFDEYPEIIMPIFFEAFDTLGWIENINRNALTDIGNEELDKYLANRPVFNRDDTAEDQEVTEDVNELPIVAQKTPTPTKEWHLPEDFFTNQREYYREDNNSRRRLKSRITREKQDGEEEIARKNLEKFVNWLAKIDEDDAKKIQYIPDTPEAKNMFVLAISGYCPDPNAPFHKIQLTKARQGEGVCFCVKKLCKKPEYKSLEKHFEMNDPNSPKYKWKSCDDGRQVDLQQKIHDYFGI